MTRRVFCITSLAALGCAGAATEAPAADPALREPPDPTQVTPLKKTNEEWKTLLSADAYHVLREQGTEMAFTGRYWNNHAEGAYLCAGCGLRLFDSKDKFESGTGWPSFTQPAKTDRVTIVRDTSHGMLREEVRCARCDGHQGHVFDDGPEPTGRRFCINSISLAFRPA